MHWGRAGSALAVVAVLAQAEASEAASVHDAFLAGFPVYEMARARQAALNRAGPAGVNQFRHRRNLTNASSRAVTTPNNDTLYSAAWLDLSGGPVTLDVPNMGGRYYSVALLDVFTDNVAVIGTRTNRGRPTRYLIAGPTWSGQMPAGVELIRSTTNDAWLLLRIFVAGDDELPTARRLQDEFHLTGTPTASSSTIVSPVDGGGPKEFLETVNSLLGRSPIPSDHRHRLKALWQHGIRPGEKHVWAALPDRVRAQWQARFVQFLEYLRLSQNQVGELHAGWSYPKAGLGNFGQDDAYRSQIALSGLAALPRDEAVYLTARVDATGAQLNGAASYRLRLPSNVPVSAFWSVSLYEAKPDGRLFFTENAISRYSVGSRTAGLKRDSDGSVTLAIQHEKPADGHANWLPAPEGPFALAFRGYLPGQALLDGSFRLEPVTVLTPIISR